MKEYEIKEGDIVEIAYTSEFTNEYVNEGKALVIWKGWNHQPLVHKLDRNITIWTGYNCIARVVGHVDIVGYMNKAMTLECEPSTDAVSREAVKKFIESFIHEIITESGIDKNAHTNEVLREVARGVGDIPPVIPERPKGER